MSREPLNGWESLLDIDPFATLFQSPVWCMPWYRTYTDFEPRLLMITCGAVLAGVAPLAVEKRSGRLTFAGDNMTDYRDVVTRPEYRDEVLTEFVHFFRAGGFRHALHFGSTLPESDSSHRLIAACKRVGVHAISRINYGWRWRPEQQEQDFFKKKSVRYSLNVFRRMGDLSIEWLRSTEQWDLFKDDFYRQHTLRQLLDGRPVSFDNPAKRAFYDAIFHSAYGHVLALRLNGGLIAGHAGFVYRNVLYWSAPSFDIRLRHYSPNLILLVLTMKHAKDWGLCGIDLTIGEGDLKERFSTTRVDLPWVELHPKAGPYYARRAHLSTTSVLRRVAGQHAWTKQIKPHLIRIAAASQVARQSGLAHVTREILGSLCSMIVQRTRYVVLAITPQEVQSIAPSLVLSQSWELRDNNIFDLLNTRDPSDEGMRYISAAARRYADAIKEGVTFHSLLVDGILAGWAYSGPDGRSEALGLRADSIIITGLHIFPEFRGHRLAEVLLAEILGRRFRQDAGKVYAILRERDRDVLQAVQNTGFRPIMADETLRMARWTRHKRRAL